MPCIVTVSTNAAPTEIAIARRMGTLNSGSTSMIAAGSSIHALMPKLSLSSVSSSSSMTVMGFARESRK